MCAMKKGLLVLSIVEGPFFTPSSVEGLRSCSKLFIPIVFVLQEIAETFVFECASEVEKIFVAAAAKRCDDN